jgi:hypothetical protein
MEKKQMMITRLDQTAKTTARPTVTQTANRMKRDDIDISNRLFNYQNTYAKKKDVVKAANEPHFSHTPVINNCSRHVESRIGKRSRSA